MPSMSSTVMCSRMLGTERNNATLGEWNICSNGVSYVQN